MTIFSDGQQEIGVRIFGKTSLIPIPYAVTQVVASGGSVTFVGVLYFDTIAPEESSTDGAFVSSARGSYHLDKNNREASSSHREDRLKASVRIDFNERKLYGRSLPIRVLSDQKIADWQEFLSW